MQPLRGYHDPDLRPCLDRLPDDRVRVHRAAVLVVHGGGGAPRVCVEGGLAVNPFSAGRPSRNRGKSYTNLLLESL